MKKYDIKVEKIITTMFTLEAKNKKEAEEMVEDIIYNSCILDFNIIEKNIDYTFVVNKLRKYRK